MSTGRRASGASPAIAAGLAVSIAIILLAGIAIGELLARAAGTGGVSVATVLADPYLWRVARFTLWQAFLSTLISVGLALPLAVLMHENRGFAGERLVLRLFALPLGLPQISAVFGILALYGERGLLRTATGLDLPSVYGLTGILIAHVFFNLPLATRMILTGLSTMPTEYERLSAQLSMGLWGRVVIVMRPFLLQAAGGAALIVFLLCVTSFTVVLVLGGGPAATTLEVAIYQSLTFDFDLARAVVLTLLQLVLAGAAAVLASRVGTGFSQGMTLAPTRRAVPGGRNFASNLPVLLAVLFVASPFIAIISRGLQADLARLSGDPAVHAALVTSLLLGACAATLAVSAALALSASAAGLARRRRFRGIPGAGERGFLALPSLVLVMPAIVLASGWFIFLRRFGAPGDFAAIMVVTINAAMALPFAVRFVSSAYLAAEERYGRLSAQLGLGFAGRWRFMLWPQLKRPVMVAFAFALALSLGDLGVIALFGSEDVRTLPFLIYQRMGAYRTQDAAGLALLLCIVTIALMVLVDRGAARKEPIDG